MLTFKQADPQHDLFRKLGSQREATGDISRARETQALSFLITITDEGEGEGGVQESAIVFEVRLPPTTVSGGGLDRVG
jgi:hypothetical protein